jgi:hypothetical protein
MVLLPDWWVLVKLLSDFCKAALDLDFAELAHERSRSKRACFLGTLFEAKSRGGD